MSQDLFGICPYVTAQRVLRGKWSIVILHHLEDGPVRFNELQRRLPEMTHATLAKQLRSLEEYGVITRTEYPQVPPKVEYVLTPSGEQLIPALDILYIWSIRQMHDRRIPIDADAFVVHKSEKYVDALGDIMRENNFWPGRERRRGVEQGEE